MKNLDNIAWNIPARFWSKVMSTKDVAKCWPWIGSKDAAGYGRLGWKKGMLGYNRDTIRAPTLSYWLNNGIVPSGAVIMHECDNPSCVNPNHLKAGTHSENFKDAANKGRLGGPTKIPLERRDEIRKELGSQREVAYRFNISSASVSRIKNRKQRIDQ